MSREGREGEGGGDAPHGRARRGGTRAADAIRRGTRVPRTRTAETRARFSLASRLSIRFARAEDPSGPGCTGSERGLGLGRLARARLLARRGPGIG